MMHFAPNLLACAALGVLSACKPPAADSYVERVELKEQTRMVTAPPPAATGTTRVVSTPATGAAH